MLRKILTWILIGLALKKRLERKPPLESLIDLLYIVYAMAIIVGAIEWLGLDAPLPWYKRWLYKLKYNGRYLRTKLIGY